MTILETRTLSWPEEADCQRSAHLVGTRPGLGRALVTLHGPLGAGKTTFSRHLLHTLGIAGPVRSPTYALVETYQAPAGGCGDGEGFMVAHFDFYRFEDPHEWEDAGLRELFAAEGLKLVEWPERADGLLPAADLAITITPGQGEQRSARFDALSPLGQALLP